MPDWALCATGCSVVGHVDLRTEQEQSIIHAIPKVQVVQRTQEGLRGPCSVVVPVLQTHELITEVFVVIPSLQEHARGSDRGT